MTASQKLWAPSKERIERSRMYEFMTRVAERYAFEPNWQALHTWSVAHPERFWPELLACAGVAPSTPPNSVMTGRGLLGAKWFEGLRLNYARHMLRFDDDSDAILFENEAGRRARYTHHELREEVARAAAALRRDGVTMGDRVVGFMPNTPEAVIAMLAATSLGAIWSSCSPDFGVRGVLARLGQIEPVVLIFADGYQYNGKRFDTIARTRDLLAELPTVRRAVLVPHLDDDPRTDDGWEAANAARVAPVAWRDYLGPVDRPAPKLAFAEVPFDHPLLIMYSSGTTGVPKCIVHGHGGTLLQHMKELMLHTDLRAGDRIFYYTTCGWMMWNWLVSSIGVGAAVVLYDGSPAHPDPARLWDLADRLGIHVFGTSPKFISACQAAGLEPGIDHDLSKLRAVLSTGSPLSDDQFAWIYAKVKADLQLSSISGGTDIISCFMLGNPMLPVYAGQIQCVGLGMDVQAWSESGQSVVGEKGELVCCTPFPSQPVGFWNDPNGSRYRAAYFEHFAAGARGDAAGPVWRHGDYVEIAETGGIIVFGRSDATLNPGGVRIGTSEIYSIVEALPEVVDSVVVGLPDNRGDVEIALFVVLANGLELDADLSARIRETVAAGATKRHVPRSVRQVPDIPRTISGKKVELAVRQALLGEDVANRDALANPEALDAFRNLL